MEAAVSMSSSTTGKVSVMKVKSTGRYNTQRENCLNGNAKKHRRHRLTRRSLLRGGSCDSSLPSVIEWQLRHGGEGARGLRGLAETHANMRGGRWGAHAHAHARSCTHQSNPQGVNRAWQQALWACLSFSRGFLITTLARGGTRGRLSCSPSPSCKINFLSKRAGRAECHVIRYKV